MLLRYYSQFDGQPVVARIKGQRVRVGRGIGNDIVLESPFVDEEAVEFIREDERWRIQVHALNGAELGGGKVGQGDSIWWDGSSSISIFPYVFQLYNAPVEHYQAQPRFTHEVHALVKAVHLDILDLMHHCGSDVPQTMEGLLKVERSIENSAKNQGLLQAGNDSLAFDLAGACVRDQILTQLLDSQENETSIIWQKQVQWSALATAVELREAELARWVASCTSQLFAGLSDAKLETRIDRIERKFWTIWDQLKLRLAKPQCHYLALRQLKKQVKDILFGFGPLEDLLRMPTITEIMVNASDEIFVEKAGVLQNSGRQFVSDEVTLTVIERIVGCVGRRIDTAQPMVDARLPDGSRVNAVIPPLAVKGPCLTVRKFAKQRFTMETLMSKKSISPQVVEFLEACVRSKRSILVSGGTGTGKTTLLNCLSQAIPHRERIICIEDTHELQLDHPHTVFVECRDGNNEGKGKVVIRDLLKNALRQRPDRLIVGECRSDEALDMLQAMNTGHDGSMTTIHANNPEDALRRLEVLVRESGLPPDAIRQQIVSAIDIVVQLTRLPDGKRCVTEVTEVVGYDEVKQIIRLRTIFWSLFDENSSAIALRPTGCIPTFVGELVRDGNIHLDLFLNGVAETLKNSLDSIA
jgi:pilus assembly protein CpaF